MPIYKSPSDITARNPNLKSIFLAGSIEMDKAIDWQKQCESELQNQFNVLNPRRESWDTSWKQDISNLIFKEQVNWELNALEQADIIIMFFANNTQSPISLLEFGLYARSKKMYVVCENEFWRKGNIDVVCERYGIMQFDNLDQLMIFLKNKKNE